MGVAPVREAFGRATYWRRRSLNRVLALGSSTRGSTPLRTRT